MPGEPISAGEVERIFDEVGHAIAAVEAEYHYRGLDREADGAHLALARVAKVRDRFLCPPARQGEPSGG